MFANLQQTTDTYSDSAPDGPIFELRGVCERLETSTQTVFVWNLSVDNLTDLRLCAEIRLDIRSYQRTTGYTPGPGLFALPPPQGPTYSMTSAGNVEASANAAYAGAGRVYTVHALPPGTSTFVLSAAIENSNPLTSDVQMRESVFSVHPEGFNYNADVQSETIFVPCHAVTDCCGAHSCCSTEC